MPSTIITLFSVFIAAGKVFPELLPINDRWGFVYTHTHRLMGWIYEVRR
jgi:hypothetical protein